MNGRWKKNYTDYYFDIPYSLIGKTHFPADRKWQIIWNVRSKEKYYNQPIYYEAFLRRNLQFKKNIMGTIVVKRGNKIPLEIKGLSINDKIVIGFANDKYSKLPTVSKSEFGDQLLIEAPRSNTQMFLFIDDRLASIFKVLTR